MKIAAMVQVSAPDPTPALVMVGTALVLFVLVGLYLLFRSKKSGKHES